MAMCVHRAVFSRVYSTDSPNGSMQFPSQQFIQGMATSPTLQGCPKRVLNALDEVAAQDTISVLVAFPPTA